MQYWNDLITEKSWKLLQKLNKEIDFILIGGWAAYLWTHAQKSKDIDIVIGFEELEKIKTEYDLKKNDRLRKYEIIVDEVDVDIYVPFYSKLSIPIEELENYVSKIEGFKVVDAEILLLLKQGAEKARGHSEKGMKDRVDIMQLLLKTKINFGKYSELTEKFELGDFRKRLILIVNSFREHEYLDLNLRELKKKKQELLQKIKSK
ncbi:MAG: hypothetical protein V1672_01840 [Candidatus Diapherotrites archaeon]